MVSHPAPDRLATAYGLPMRITFTATLLAFLLAGCPEETSTHDAGADDDAAHTGGDDSGAHHSTDDTGVVGNPSCESIIARCHDVDTGEGRIAECHELAHDHDSTEADCAAIVEECVALCTSVDAGAGHHDSDAGAHEH